MKKILFLAVSLMMIMSSCAAPVEVPIPTTEVISIPTETPTPSVTPTPKPTLTVTPTPDPTPTVTSTPETTPTTDLYNVFLQENAPLIADVLGWGIEYCGPDVVDNQWDRGIFLVTSDYSEYFCDFEGYSMGVSNNPSPDNPQRLLTLVETQFFLDYEGKETAIGRLFVVFESSKVFFSDPSAKDADTLVKVISNGEYVSLEDVRKKNPSAWIPLRMWVLEDEEYTRFISDPYLSKRVPVLDLNSRW